MILEEGPAALWAGSCDSCDVSITIDGDGTDVPGPALWEGFPNCPICQNMVSFDEYDETSWQRESRLMFQASNGALKHVIATLSDLGMHDAAEVCQKRLDGITARREARLARLAEASA